jgi:hypothetical protein
MPILKTRCSDEMASRFHALAKVENLRSSMLLRRMVAAVVAQHGAGEIALPKSDTRGGRGGHGSRIMLRLRPAEVEAIRALAEPEGYSASAWIVRQLRQRLVGAVPFANAELDALRDAIRELGAIGRNLNTLLHVLHRSGRFEQGALDLKRLSEGVEQLRSTVVATMTRATERGHRAEK